MWLEGTLYVVEGTLYVAGGTMYVSIVVGLGAVGAVCVVRTEVAAGGVS